LNCALWPEEDGHSRTAALSRRAPVGGAGVIIALVNELLAAAEA